MTALWWALAAVVVAPTVIDTLAARRRAAADERARELLVRLGTDDMSSGREETPDISTPSRLPGRPSAATRTEAAAKRPLDLD